MIPLAAFEEVIDASGVAARIEAMLPAGVRARQVRGRYRGSKGRAFFSPYQGKDDAAKVRYCRHYAAGLYFQRWGRAVVPGDQPDLPLHH